MSKKNKPNFFNKFFKKKSDKEHDDDLDAELNEEGTENFTFDDAEVDDAVEEYEERYHSDDDSSLDITEGIQLEDPEEVFDATEFSTLDINKDSNTLTNFSIEEPLDGDDEESFELTKKKMDATIKSLEKEIEFY